MKTNICKLSQDKKGLKDILIEAEKIAKYNELDKKSSLRLTLLAEEMVGLLDELVESFQGEFYIENNNNEYKLFASLSVGDMSIELKNSLIDVSKNKKNSSAKGILGKIRNAVQTFMLRIDGSDIYVPIDDYGYSHYGYDSLYSYKWSLEDYKNEAKKEEEKYDELEKSIIANLADDVIVGIKGKQIEITIKKVF